MCILNDQQRAAVEFLEGTAIVVAVPGSGKTLTMIHRIAHLVQNGIDPSTIVGITFTKNAAQTLKERLQALLGDEAAKVNLSTIHSLCYRILTTEGRQFKFIADFERAMIIQRILKRLKLSEITTGQAIAEICFAKNHLLTPAQYMTGFAADKVTADIGRIYQLYEDYKSEKGLVDFEDLLTDTHHLLSTDPNALAKYQAAYRHLLIDEFQDTNPAQLEIVKLIADDTGPRSLFVVGDDSQSIYSFTGASIENVINFRDIFPAAIEFRLTLNYRSTPQILIACRNLISHNRLKIDKELHTPNLDGGNVHVMEAATEDDEALQVVTEIKSLVKSGIRLEDMVVLYRANFQSRTIEETFLRNAIPFRLESGQSFYQRKEVSCLVNYLQVIHDPESDQALLNILNVPNRYLGNQFSSRIREYSTANNQRIYSALQAMPIEVDYEKKGVADFLKLIENLRVAAINKTAAEVIQLVRSMVAYDKHFTESDISGPDDQKVANIDQLQNVAENYQNVAAFLEYVQPLSQVRNASPEGKGVRLMTIHKSKGMEFPVVFIIGLVENILPFAKGEIEEERRIAFVGMSRASTILHLSHAHTYNGKAAKRSSFISEIIAPAK